MIVVFDLDGTICDTAAREMIARDAARASSPEAAQKAWDEFHEGIPNDTPIRATRKTLLAMAAAGHAIELWTARPERYRKETLMWLRKHEIPYSTLLMRGDNDRRPSYILKLEWFMLSHPKPEMVFEDHPETTRLLRAAGVTVACMDDGRNHT